LLFFAHCAHRVQVRTHAGNLLCVHAVLNLAITDSMGGRYQLSHKGY